MLDKFKQNITFNDSIEIEVRTEKICYYQNNYCISTVKRSNLVSSFMNVFVQAEVFMNDFEEEKKFERQIAELKQEIAEQKGMVNTQKIQIAQMTAEMKSKSQTSKEVIRGMKEKVEEQSRDIVYYKKKANKIPQLDSELQKYKKVLKDVNSKLDQKVMELSELNKEAIKLKDQVCLLLNVN